MNKRNLDLKSLLLAGSILISALIGILYTYGGTSFEVTNIYGDTVEIYGDGIYAYNSILNVSSRLGADVTGIIGAIILISLCIWKSKPLWAEILKTSIIIYLTYYAALLVFGLSMNRLYFLYAFCFGIGIFTSFISVKDLFSMIEIPTSLRKKSYKGTAVFLIITGILVALIWISCILPVTINGEFGSLLGIQTNEATYGIDFGITCPLLIICGRWILKKKDIGYKTAPLLLNMLAYIALLVIIQRAYCLKLGVEVPMQALIILIISFVILGVIAFCLSINLVRKLTKNKTADEIGNHRDMYDNKPVDSI
jgi:hypothetical protein